MIRLEIFPILRALLLACALGQALTGCSSDGRLDLKRLDLSKLQPPGWLVRDWNRQESQKETAKTAPPAGKQSAGAPATADSTSPAAPALPKYTVTPAAAARTAQAQALPRPKPWRPIPASPSRQASAPEIKEQPARAPQGKVTSEAPQALAVLPPAGKPPRAQSKGGYSPDDLIGLDGPSVERLLGKPDLSRKEPFAEVWQYAHGDCVLFLFIYAGKDGPARVSHAETGARDGGETPEPGQCIGAMLSRHAATPG